MFWKKVLIHSVLALSLTNSVALAERREGVKEDSARDMAVVHRLIQRLELAYPEWSEESSEEQQPNGGVKESRMWSSPNAERAELHGWLSHGARMSFVRLPDAGGLAKASSVEEKELKKVVSVTIGRAVAGYDRAQVLHREDFNLGGLRGEIVSVAGEKKELLREPEVAILLVLRSREVALTIELSAPVSEKEEIVKMTELFQKALSD